MAPGFTSTAAPRRGEQPLGTHVNIRLQTWALPLAGERKPVQISSPEFGEYGGRLSPDGQWLASASIQSGLMEVYVQRFPSGTQRTMVSRGGGVHPRWTRNGREIVYWVEAGGIKGVPLEFTNAGVAPGPPEALVTAAIPLVLDDRAHYDVTHNGDRFLLRQPIGTLGSKVTVIVNWAERMKR
jgi:hypothetical protein